MRRKYTVGLIFLLTAALLCACSPQTDDPAISPLDGAGAVSSDLPALGTDLLTVPDTLTDGANTLTVTCSGGTADCWRWEGNTLIFSGMTEDTVCSVSGELDGAVTVDAGERKFELELCGATVHSASQNPITVLSGDSVTLTAKSGTENFLYDLRAAVDDTDETAHAAAVWSEPDLDLRGKGSLTVVSQQNNGIHSKDGLTVKNLTLSVSCRDNALKGNDGVSAESGTLTLIAVAGDGIKTTATDVSAKGNQRGTVALSGGAVTVYAACDGIDAAYDADLSGDVVLSVGTGAYSGLTENSASDGAALTKNENPGTATLLRGGFAPGGAPSRDPGAIPGGGMGRPDGGFPGGMPDGEMGRPDGEIPGGGMPGEGNSEKTEGSQKGIKAGNAVNISGGTVVIRAQDDALHATAGTALENGKTSAGTVDISGGTLEIFSSDDGIHADGALTVSGGKVKISGSYEGLEGTAVTVSGGDISVISRDDGINSTAKTGDGITVSGGTLYVYAGGDGLDANTTASYRGLVFSGGKTVVISTSGGNSALDSERGYSFTGGQILAVGLSGGMSSESRNCADFSAVASSDTLRLTSGEYLTVTVDGKTAVCVKNPADLSASVIYLGAKNAKFSQTASADGADPNGVRWG